MEHGDFFSGGWWERPGPPFVQETEALGSVRLSEQTGNLLRERENSRGRERGAEGEERWGDKRRSDLEVDNSKFGVDSSIHYGSCQDSVRSLGAA